MADQAQINACILLIVHCVSEFLKLVKLPRMSLQISKEEFRQLGHHLIDLLADHFSTLEQKNVSPGERPATVRKALGQGSLPEQGRDAHEVIQQAHDLLMEHSLFTGHPRFWGYIIGAGTQVGALSDMLAATINPNVGGWNLSPMATEMELQVVQWIAEFIGYPQNAGGILVSGGAMANYVGFLTARKAMASWDIRKEGIGSRELCVYCSKETHTWIEKATDLFGLGTNAIRWIPTNADLRMDAQALRTAIKEDEAKNKLPFLVIANAGTVSTGTVDDLEAIGKVARDFGLWYHVDGAYGVPAAGLPELTQIFEGLSTADSIALDPHKWFYCPLEAGCILVKDATKLPAAFSYKPPYYRFEEFEDAPGISFYEYGIQNSRGFRALKVWTGFLQAGRSGMQEMIRHDIAMATLLFQLIEEASDFEAFQTNLSITTFRYVPTEKNLNEQQLNALNEKLMVALQNSGKAFLTNAMINGKFLLRACIVNYRTREEDIRSLPAILRELAKEISV
jgi:glutamate/tyrosine decarboxylase-like PLP-dependent enzyme